MKKEHKEKIDKALTLCEESYKDFFCVLDSNYSKEEASKLKYFFLENTVFAGGLFRSIFTDQPVNDVDIFFTTEDAAIEFQHMFLKDNKIFNKNDITSNGTYMWKKLSFITRKVGEGKQLLESFDFTFNRHLFKLNSFEMYFDTDTFEKKGRVLFAKDSHPINLYIRALRFNTEGFKITKESMLTLASKIASKYSSDRIYRVGDLLQENDVGFSGNASNFIKDSFKTRDIFYTRDDYYGNEKPEELYNWTEYKIAGATGLRFNAADFEALFHT